MLSMMTTPLRTSRSREAPSVNAQAELPAADDAEAPAPVMTDPYMCPDCVTLQGRVATLEVRVNFLEDLLEVPADQRYKESAIPQLRLRGGGKSGKKKDDVVGLPDTYEGVFKRAQQLCPQFAKAQLRTLLRADTPLCERLHKADDASLIRIIVAAGKRNGMQPMVTTTSPTTGKRQGSTERPTTPTRPSLAKAKASTLSLGEPSDHDDEQTPVLTLLSTFSVPTVTSLRPGESGVLLGEGPELVAHMLNRFAGSAGTAAIVTPAKYSSVAVEPLEMVLQFQKVTKDQPTMTYTSLAFVYRLTAETPTLQGDAPILKLQPQRRSTVLGLEVLKIRETTDLYAAMQAEKPDYQTIKKHLASLMPKEELGNAILECFMAKATTTASRCLVRVSLQRREDLLAVSGERSVFWVA